MAALRSPIPIEELARSAGDFATVIGLPPPATGPGPHRLTDPRFGGRRAGPVLTGPDLMATRSRAHRRRARLRKEAIWARLTV